MALKNVIKFILWYLLVSSGCSANQRLNKRDSVLQKSQSYAKEEPGFFSRIASWFYPFGTSKNEIDTVPSAGHHSPSYLPPPNKPPPKYLPPENLSPPHYPRNIPIAQETSDCNPCNREPWIPIPGKSGRNNIINFVPPQQVSNVVDGLNPPPHHGPPNPSSQYGLPSSQNSLDAITAFEPPSSLVHQDLPKIEYGPPKTSAPSNQYGVPNIEITPSVLVGSLVTPPNLGFFNQYVPVTNRDKAPETPSTFPQVPKLYGPPVFKSKTKLAPIPNNPSVRDHMIPPPIKNQQHNNYINILGMRPPPPPSGFNSHLQTVQHHKNPNSIQDILQPPVSQYSVLDEEFPPYTSKPIDAYSTPDIHGIEQIPLSSGDNDEFGYPIAFPNLSIRPLVPLHNHIQFRQGPIRGEKVESIQILQSVPIADYVSSIEHPINVIQSPIVDLSLLNEPDTTKLININDQNNHPQYTTLHVTPKTNTIQSGLFVNPIISSGKLNEHPIVVDDVQTAASSLNETYQKSDNSERDNNEDIGIHSLETSTISISGREVIEDINSIYGKFENELRSSLDKKNASKELKFTEPPFDYSQWTPTWGGVSVDMTPPSVQSSWTTSFDSTEAPTKKTKHIQIIIPYYNFNNTPKSFIKEKTYSKNIFFNKKGAYTTLLPVYTPPTPTEQSLWSHFLDNSESFGTKTTSGEPFKKPTVHNIQDLLGGKTQSDAHHLPFDILTFQKNIDEWTQQAFSKTTQKLSSSEGLSQKLNPSKRIPDQYLTTVPYDYTTIQPLSNYLSDQDQAGSVRKENFKDEIGNNLLYDTTTEEISTELSTTEMSTEKYTKTTIVESSKDKKSLWDDTDVTVSSDSKEKVYIVTPASTVTWSLPPKIVKESETTENTLLFDHPKFSIRIEKNNSDSSGNRTTKVIFSEWPHKINNLQTTTVKTTSRHPLFGLMDVSAYKPPENKVIAIVNGHSRVLQDLASFVKEHTRSN